MKRSETVAIMTVLGILGVLFTSFMVWAGNDITTAIKARESVRPATSVSATAPTTSTVASDSSWRGQVVFTPTLTRKAAPAIGWKPRMSVPVLDEEIGVTMVMFSMNKDSLPLTAYYPSSSKMKITRQIEGELFIVKRTNGETGAVTYYVTDSK